MNAIMSGDDEAAIECVHGLAELERWTGGEYLNQSVVKVPSPIAAYNQYMNAVDRMDQKRSTNSTKRKEAKLSTTMFTYFLGLAALQAYSIYEHLQSSNVMNFAEFKRCLCESLVAGHRLKGKAASESTTIARAPAAVAGADTSNYGHMLIQNIRKADIHCLFCMHRGIKRKSIYGCVACKKGFHVRCYTAYHYQDA